MVFQPTYQFHLIPEQDYLNQIPVIEQELQNYAIHGRFSSFDGCKLDYELYPAKKSHATIIIIHGLSEFYKKYYEMTWYFINMGYNVLLFDQRGHGLSDRDIEGLSLIHVKQFDDYVKDLDCIIQQLVLPSCPDVPVYLFAHSMGGAVAGLYLAYNSKMVKRAVLSSPMICPYAYGVPIPIVKLKTLSCKRKDGWTGRFPYSSDFNPNVKLEHASDISYARFRHNLDYRIGNPLYQTSAMTNQWMWEAIQMQHRLLSAKVTNAIQADVLLLNAGKDNAVRVRPQQWFAKKVKTCTYYTFPESKHSIYTASDDILEEYYRMIFRFLEGDSYD